MIWELVCRIFGRRTWEGLPRPATYEHDLLMTRVALHAGSMPIECVREMNAVFERYYDISPLRTRHLTHVGDDDDFEPGDVKFIHPRFQTPIEPGERESED